MKKMGSLLIRADANRRIGSGHAMRCSAVAAEAVRLGCGAVFAVSDEGSAAFAEGLGFPARILPGDARSLGREDAMRLAGLAEELEASCLLVDSYAATDAFFDGLGVARRQGVTVACIDDLFTFEEGYRTAPLPRNVDAVVNYSFSASEAAYARAYDGSSADLLIGPTYAPVRRQFRCGPRACRPEVRRILVTTGSTNQGGLLEGLVEACLNAAPEVHVAVVVGKMASYDGPAGGRVDVLRDVAGMAALMEDADLALSAAGSTLYELAAMGVPTVAVASTENQSLNADGFERLALGPVVLFEEGRFAGGDLGSIVSNLVEDLSARAAMAERGSSVVDGRGAERIVRTLGC